MPLGPSKYLVASVHEQALLMPCPEQPYSPADS